MKALLGLVGRNGATAVAAGLGLIALVGGLALQGTSLYLISRAALRPGTLLLLLVPITGVRFFSLLRAVGRYGERLATHDATFRLLRDVRVAVFRRLVHGALPEGRGAAVETLSIQVDRLQAFYAEGLAPLLPWVASLAAVAVALGLGDRSLLLAFLPFPPAAAVLLLAAVRLGRDAGRRLPRLGAAATQELVDAAEADGDPLLVHRRGELLAALGRALRQEIRERRRSASEASLGAAAGRLLAGLAELALLAAALPLVASGRLAGDLLASAAVLAALAFGPLPSLTRAAAALGESAALAERLDLARVGEDAPPRPAGAGPAPAAWDLALSGVFFRYDPHAPWLLEDVSASLPEGAHVLLTGPSGEGKSTLVALLSRRLRPQAGRIAVGGVELERIDEPTLRAGVGVVAPWLHVFDATVADNLRLAKPEATDEELWEALAAVDLADLVRRLPGRLTARVGPSGHALSGGERRRLLLAGLLLRPAALVLLDEPMAGLDRPTRRRVEGALAPWLSGRTVLYVTHEPPPDWPFLATWYLRDGRLEVRRQA